MEDGTHPTRPEVVELIEQIFDVKIKEFKKGLDLELAPVLVAVRSHGSQMREIRSAHNSIAKSQVDAANNSARTDASVEALRDEMRHNHTENQSVFGRKLDALLEEFHRHLGEQAGEEKAQDEREKASERRHNILSTWVKTLLGAVSLGGVWKLVVALWNKHHSR